MYIIINNKKIEVKYYNTFISKLKGFMFKKDILYGIYFKTKGIHTFFMKCDIDIIATNKDNKIIYLESNLSKNKIRYIKKAKYIYEMPINTVKYLKLNTYLEIKKDS